MRKSNLLFIAIIFSFLSCKEKNSEFIFSWKGDFSHEFLELAVDNPEMLSPGVNKETEKSKNSTSSTGLVLSSKPLED